MVGVDAGAHCCKDMSGQVARTCGEHPDRSDCPDCLVDYWDDSQVYGLIVHDGGGCQRPICCPRWWPGESPRGWLFGGGEGVLVLASGSVFESVAVAGGGDDVGVVAEAVEEADGGWLVG